MADPSLYTYPSPLEGYENAPQLSDEKAEDGKSEFTYLYSLQKKLDPNQAISSIISFLTVERPHH